MDIRRYRIGTEEECVLYECKGRFEENYPRYVTYILNNKHIPRKIVKIYRKMPLTYAIKRINRFFTGLTEQCEQNRLQDDCICLSPQPLAVYDGRDSSSTSEENEYVTIDLSDQSQETVEEENDIVNTDDIHNDSQCLIIILDSGIFPRCHTTSDLSENLFTQFDLESDCTINQQSEFSDNCLREILTEPIISTGASSDSIDEQVPPTPPITQFDNTLISSMSSRLPCRQRYQTRLYRPQNIRRPGCNSQEILSTTNQR